MGQMWSVPAGELRGHLIVEAAAWVRLCYASKSLFDQSWPGFKAERCLQGNPWLCCSAGGIVRLFFYFLSEQQTQSSP